VSVSPWCEWGGRQVDQVVTVGYDRDGEHPHPVLCECGTRVTPFLRVNRQGWFFEPHTRPGA
jgi:hypothetical protein